jgi:2,3-dihydroxybiphenyl 1,2-dioxygenase
MSRLKGLGYIGFRSTDLDGWARFGRDFLGGEVVTHGESLLIRLDEKAFRLSVSEGDNALDFVGWDVGGYAQFDSLLAHLEANGVVVKEQPDLASERMVGRLATCTDPAGNSLEFFCGGREPRRAMNPGRGEARYVTGDLGLGHVVITTPDLEATKHFYLDLLGFKISDMVGASHFTRINRRHHSLAFRQLDGPTAFRHFSLELETLDMVGRAMEVAEATGFPIACGLGRHVNDRMISFYVKTPSGFEVEVGTGGRTVDDETWSTSTYESTSFWGHKRTIPIT